MANIIDALKEYFTSSPIPYSKKGTGMVNDYMDQKAYRSSPMDYFQPQTSMQKLEPSTLRLQKQPTSIGDYFGNVGKKMNNAAENLLRNIFGTYSVQGSGMNEPIPPMKDEVVPSQVVLQNPDTEFADYIRSQASADAAPENIYYLVNNVLPLTRKYGIPDAVAAGQWAAEGRFMRPSNNNYWNLMWRNSPEEDLRVWPYENIENNVRDYDLTLRNLASLGLGISQDQFGYDKYAPDEIIRAIQSGPQRFEMHSPYPTEYIDLVLNTPEYRYFAGL